MSNKALSFRTFARIPTAKLLKIQRLINNNLYLFGLTLYSFQKRTYQKDFNLDALHVRIDHMIKSAKRGLRGIKDEFLELIEDLGYETSASQALAGPTGLTANTITTTTATADWADYTGAATYNLYVYDEAGTTLVQTHEGLTASTKALTGLTLDTTYTLKVRALWDSGTQFTNLSTAQFTTAAV